MIRYIKLGYNKITHAFRVAFLYLLIAMANLELQLFKYTGGTNTFGGGVITRMLFNSSFLEKMFQGKHDEQYVQKFYEILKKADDFMRKSTPHKMAATADRHTRIIEDKESVHFGFFDERHRHYGKTPQEVFEIELEERRTKDDKYKLIKIINNKPIPAGLSTITDVVKEVKNKDGKIVYIVDDINKKSKQNKFPIRVVRSGEKCINKIEELTDFVHIKEKSDQRRRFEFFIPLKFKTNTFEDDTTVIKDILNVDEFYIQDEYGELTGYSIEKFIKRFVHNDMYEVFRFDGFEMSKIN